jgi:predicted aspartyl protease
MINGRGPYRFMVDTGASDSTVSPQLAQTLGLTAAEDTILLNGITGTSRVPSVGVDRLQAGDLIFKALRMPVVWAPVMAGSDGILGIAGLKSERIVVDFAHNRVTISHSYDERPPPGFVRIPAHRLENGLIMIYADVGWVRARAIVDTGAEHSLGNLALRDALRVVHERRIGHRKITDVYGSTSEVVPGELLNSPTIALDRVKIGDVSLVYGDFHIFDIWNLRNRPALIIGMDVLGAMRGLAIDFRSQELFLESPDFGV